MARIAARSKFWGDPRLIEAYCAERTKKLLHYMDELFEDLVFAVNEELGMVAGTAIEAQRHAVEKANLSMHLINMQVEVFRRAMEHKCDDLSSLVQEKTRIITLANDRLASKPLPVLPSEIVAQIFTSLYFIEGEVQSGWLRFAEVSNSKTTLQLFLDDEGTTEDWRRLIRRDIPGVFAGAGEVDASGLLGSHPRLLPTDDSDASLGGSPTTVLATVIGWPTLKDKISVA